jgi:hypothetical protein
MSVMTSLRNERGIILPTTLIIVAVLMSLAIGLLALGGFEPSISKNLESGSQARGVAEAGVEWAFTQLAASTDWSTLLAAAGSNGIVLATNQAVPGLGAAYGTFTVRVRNDNQANDNQITGVVVDTGGNTTDTNSRVIVTATGTVGTASRTIRTVVRRNVLPAFPAALSFPGNQADTSFSGSAFEINGNDFNMNDTAGGCGPAFGISTSTATYETNVQNALSSAQKQDVKGKKQLSSGTAYGDNVIAQDTTLTKAAVSAFVSAIAAKADVKLQSTQAAPLGYSNIGTSCSSDWNSSTCWGTATKPKIVHVKGDPDPTSAFTALQLNGTTGYGILIVEDGDLRINGSFNWNGIVIVTGQYVGLGFLGGGTQGMHGTVIVNETQSDAGYEGVVTGNASLRYSCEAITLANSSPKLLLVSGWKEI